MASKVGASSPVPPDVTQSVPFHVLLSPQSHVVPVQVLPEFSHIFCSSGCIGSPLPPSSSVSPNSNNARKTLSDGGVVVVAEPSSP